MGLTNFPAQPETSASLLCALSRGRLAHAYIFSGPRGSGKTELARALAAAVLCASSAREPGDGAMEGRLSWGDACGACGACGLVSQDSHPDLEVFRPTDGRASYPVKQVREEIRRRAYLKPALGPKRFIVIDRAEALVRTSGSRNEAADTLLKLLEEPAPDTVLVLLSTAAERLPDTVLSRCQHLRLRPPGVDRLAAVVSSETGRPRSECVFLAHLTAGDLDAVRGLLAGRKKERVDVRSLRDLVTTLASSAGRMPYADLFASASALEGYCRGEALLAGALRVLGLIFRDAALAGPDFGGALPVFGEEGPEADAARGLSGRYPKQALRSAALRALRAQEDLRRSPARLLLLEVLLLDLRSILEDGLVS